MRINGIRRRFYFHHYFDVPPKKGLHLYNLAMGWSLLTVGVHWCPFTGGGTKRMPWPGGGYHIWLCLPFVSLMLEWRR